MTLLNRYSVNMSTLNPNYVIFDLLHALNGESILPVKIDVLRRSNVVITDTIAKRVRLSNLVPEALNSMFSYLEIKGFENFSQFTLRGSQRALRSSIIFADDETSLIGNGSPVRCYVYVSTAFCLQGFIYLVCLEDG